MAIWTFPLKSINGSNMYSDKDFRRFYANIFSSGIIPNIDLKGNLSLQVLQTEIPSMSIRVGPGVDMINGGHIMNTNFKSFSVPAPLTTQKRIDCIVAQWNESTNSGDIIYKKNTTQVIRSQNIWEHKLAEIVVPANATSISQVNIKDTRADPEVCGYSSPFEQIDVGDLMAQYETQVQEWFNQAKTNVSGMISNYDQQFQVWFKNLKNQLDDNQAGNLQNQINNSIHDAGSIDYGTDLNTLINPGFYTIRGEKPNAILHYPSGVSLTANDTTYSFVVVYKSSSNSMVTQHFLDNLSGDFFVRKNDWGAWSDWKKIAFDSEVVHLTGEETITGSKTFKELHFSSDTPKTPLEIDTNWTANGHYVKMTNGILSIHIEGIRPKKDGLTGQTYYTVAKLPSNFRKFVSDHHIEFVWSNVNGGASRYGGKVEKGTGNIIFYLMPGADKINSNHRFSVYIPYVPV